MKSIKAKVRLQIKGGGATPAPPVGSVLGQHQVNIMSFCSEFNARTSQRKGELVPIVITIYTDKTFDFVIKTSPTSELIKAKAGIKKGSGKPNMSDAGSITWKDVDEVANIKMKDLNAWTLESARKIVAGTAKSMGLLVKD